MSAILAKKRVLIIGAAGFTGRYLVNFLSENTLLEVYTDGSISDIKPEEVYQLQGSFTNQFDIDYASNVLSTKKLLDVIRTASLQTRVLLVGSSAEYGFPIVPDNGVAETHPLRPVSVYGLMKLFQTELMGTYIRLYDMDIVAVRPFNLFGKGMSPILFTGKIEQEIVSRSSFSYSLSASVTGVPTIDNEASGNLFFSSKKTADNRF